jgi:hypothetical protein
MHVSLDGRKFGRFAAPPTVSAIERPLGQASDSPAVSAVLSGSMYFS